jgi:metal-responsive CopG/Arc/MetJ family transcriptional regulator
MPTEKPKIILVMEDNLLKRIDDFRFDNRINSRSEAIRRLLEEALEKYAKPQIKKK